MVYQWEPWTQYNAGAVCEYGGQLYQVIQPHQSEPNWQPPNVPALWNRLPEEACGDYREGRRHHGVEEHHRTRSRSGERYGDNRPQPGGWGHDEHRDERREHYIIEEQHKSRQPPKEDEGWLTEKRKHELEIGGGVLGALAIGAGVYAYSHHKSKASEEAKRQAWQSTANEQTWQQGAAARTQHYSSGGQGPPVHWILTEAGKPFPHHAVVGGHEHNQPLYIARAFYQGGLHVGKAAPHLNNDRGGCSIAWGGREIHDIQHFEILVGDDNAARWVNYDCRNGPLRVEGWQPVEGGKESDGRFIFVAQVCYEGGVHPAKYTEGEHQACVGYGGEEKTCTDFNVLAYR